MFHHPLRKGMALALLGVTLLCGCGASQPQETASRPETIATAESVGHYSVTITNYDASGQEVQYTYSQAPNGWWLCTRVPLKR